MSDNQEFVILTTTAFSLLPNFALVLKTIKKKTTYKTFTKTLLLWFSPVLCWLPVYTTSETTLTKTFVLYFGMGSFMLKLFKTTTKDKHTKTCCVAREHYCVVLTYTYFQLLDTEKDIEEKRPEIKSSKGSGDFLKRNLIQISQKILWMERTLTRTKEKKINFAVSINSIGNMLW